MAKEKSTPESRVATIRASMRDCLRGEPVDTLEISQRVGVSERDVAGHLEHLQRSLRQSGEKLQIEPSTCKSCGFVFEGRKRLDRPSRCPKCHASRISRPRFSVVSA